MNVVCNDLEVYQIRNLNRLKISFSGNRIGLVGENGHGKTNIIEAIYFAMQGSSWRTNADQELLAYGVNEGYTKINTSIGDDKTELKCDLICESPGNRFKKRFFVNGVGRTRKFLMGRAPVLLFAPDDLGIVVGSPGLRRGYLDRFLSVVDYTYAQNLLDYQKIIQSRNRLLEDVREGSAKVDNLDYWTEQMIELGCRVITARQAFWTSLAVGDEYGVVYKPNICSDKLKVQQESLKECYLEKIRQNLSKEILSGTSQYGPHKDDYLFEFRGLPVEAYGSRGQQRSVLLWFIREQVRYLTNVRGIMPLVLLDDMFSELDAMHRDAMLAMFEGAQLFVTGCEDYYFEKSARQFDQLWRVVKGNLVLV